MKKRCLSVLLTLAMCLSLLPTAALAAEPITTTVTGESSVTMQKGVAFFGTDGGYYELTPPTNVTFTSIEWSVTGDLPTGISLGKTTDGIAKAFLTGTPTAMTNGTVAVTISASATDSNSNTYTGSINVSITVEDSPPEMRLDELIQEAACEVPMAMANTQDAVISWMQNTWLPSLSGYSDLVNQLEQGMSITVEAVAGGGEGSGFVAAVAGTESDPDGTDGSLTVGFRLDNNSNYLDNHKTCTIKATAYSVSPDTPEPLTISVSHAYLIGGGSITITTSKPADQVMAALDEDKIGIETTNNITWTATIPDDLGGKFIFIANAGEESAESKGVYLSPDFWINPTSETLTGGGTVTLVTAVPVSSVTCNVGGINVQGSGDEWRAYLPNSTATYTFTATLDNHTATCTVSVVKRNTAYVTDNSSDDDNVIYTPPIPTDTEQSENGETVTTAEPSTVIKKDTATSTITATDGNRLVNELVRNGSDQLVIAPKIGQDVSGVEVSIPATVVKQLAERTDADLQIATGFAEVNIGSDELDGHSGSLVMEAQRTEGGISTKVSIGGVSVLDTSVMLFVSLNNLPDDGKLVVGTLQPGADALNFLPLTETTEPSTRMAMVPEDIIKSTDATVIGPDGESYTQHERLLINGKEYYVSGSGDGESLSLYDKEGNIYSYDGEKAPQEIGQDAGTEYPENEFININGAVYQIHSVQRDTYGNGTLILYLDGKPAGMCQFDQYEEVDSINIYNEDYAPDKVKERQQNSNQLGTVTPGENPIDGLESGKTYNVSVIGAQDISVPGYDEAVLNSIKAETEAEKAAKEEVERLKADMEAKEAALDQMSDSDPNYWYAMTALSDAEAAYEAALAELAALANLQSATVTQTFDIPNELVGRTDVTFVAVHNPNPFPVPGSSIRDDIADFIEEWHKQWEETYRPEIGTVEVSEDGQTLTATYTVSSFSPFTIYAFVETEDDEAKVIGSPFADVSTDAWYYDAVKYAYDNGLMAGTSTTERLFSPEGTTTRAQIVTILHRLEGAPAVDYLMQFSDVAEGQWHTEAIRWAASTGITSGTGDGTTFSPNDPITREQLAAFLYRYAQYKGYDVSVGEDTNILSYEDAFTVSEYAYPALQWACGAGIIGGMNSASGGMILDPQGSATRAQAAVMLMRFCENVNK